MLKTRRNRVLKRGTYKRPREEKISVGLSGDIRSKEELGLIYVSKMPDDILIDGCSWKGAYAIYNFLSPLHKSITDGSNFYFMLPDNGDTINRDSALFLVLFHHLYNFFLIKEPWTCPPFRSPIKIKYEYLQNVFKSNFEIDLVEQELIDIQSFLQQSTYSSWADFIRSFINPWSKEETLIKHTVTERLDLLSKICINAEDVLDFLSSPIDSEKILLKLIPTSDNNEIDGLCNILLEKIDQHIIFAQTGIKPIEMNWIKTLDLYLFL